MMVVLAWIDFAVTIKRLHDRNKAGWWPLPGDRPAGPPSRSPAGTLPAPQVPTRPPSFFVITTVAERGRLPAP